MDYSEIQKQVENVISVSQDIDDVNADALMATWYENKKSFIDAFNGKLIVEYPTEVSFSLSEEDKLEKVRTFADRIAEVYNNYGLSHFIEDNEKSFFANRVTNNERFPEIPLHMKLLKAFKYFEDNVTTLKIMQDEASQLVQEDKIHGRLCFSVHPLDYLSSSENNYKWRSCHSLDGIYRCGNLSYMSDPTTVICYIKGEDDYQHLPRFGSQKWNSKKWRMLVFFSTDKKMLALGRQYPFTSDEAANTVKSCLSGIFDKRYGDLTECHIDSDVLNKAFPNLTFQNLIAKNYIPVNHQLVPVEDIVKDQSHLHYDDLLYSTCYTMQYCFDTEDYWYDPNDPIPQILVGNKVKCLRCGKEDLDCAESMLCEKCEHEVMSEQGLEHCACCDAITPLEDLYTVHINGRTELVCEDCKDSECFVCDHCEKLFYIEDDENYVSELGEYLCNDCYEAYRDSQEVLDY